MTVKNMNGVNAIESRPMLCKIIFAKIITLPISQCQKIFEYFSKKMIFTFC